MRRLRGGTGSASIHAVAPHNLNRVVLTRATAERGFLYLSVELLIFPDFEAFFHELFEQTNRIAPSLPRGFFKPFP
jgi:hypothetical protein